MNKAAEKQSIQRVGGSRGVHTANRKSKAAQGKQAPVVYSYKKKTNEAALALPLIPLANQAIATGAAAWSLYNMSKKKSPGQGNLFGKGSEGNPYSGRYQRKGNTKQNRNARQNAIDQWRKDNGLPPDSKAEPPWPK